MLNTFSKGYVAVRVHLARKNIGITKVNFFVPKTFTSINLKIALPIRKLTINCRWLSSNGYTNAELYKAASDTIGTHTRAVRYYRLEGMCGDVCGHGSPSAHAPPHMF